MALSLKTTATNLRKNGKTYSEIQKILNKKIPKSTLSYWFKNIVLSKQRSNRIERIIKNNARKARLKAVISNRNKREKYLLSIYENNSYLSSLIKNKDIAKITLAVLYLSEGAKQQKGIVMFGNSDPKIISLFLRLMRKCYDINEEKFRCTLQCRADQNVKELENFWSKITKIPLEKFYKARIDPRTINKPSRKKNYKGVLRINYFSAHIFNELMIVGGIISEGL